jgi:hypothetical protein
MWLIFIRTIQAIRFVSPRQIQRVGIQRPIKLPNRS